MTKNASTEKAAPAAKPAPAPPASSSSSASSAPAAGPAAAPAAATAAGPAAGPRPPKRSGSASASFFTSKTVLLGFAIAVVAIAIMWGAKSTAPKKRVQPPPEFTTDDSYGTVAVAPQKTTKERLDRLGELTEWITTHGGYVSPAIRLGYSKKSGFGVFARDDIAPAKDPNSLRKSEILASIPRHLCITINSLEGTHLAPLLKMRIKEQYRERVLLSTFIAMCRFQVNCHWAKYVATTYVENEDPFVLDAKLLEKLVMFESVKAIDLINDGIYRFWADQVNFMNTVEIPMPEGGRFSFEAFSWAWWYVGSHAIYRDNMLTMVPLIDLFNYMRDERSVQFSNKTALFSVSPVLGVKRGDQVYVGYSSYYRNLNTWGWYSWTGWAPEDILLNEESLPMYIELKDAIYPLLPGEDKLYNERIEALNALGYRNAATNPRIGGGMKVELPSELIPFLRIAAANTSEEIRYIIRHGGNNPVDEEEDTASDPSEATMANSWETRMRLDIHTLRLATQFFERENQLRNNSNYEAVLAEVYGPKDDQDEKVRVLAKLMDVEIRLTGQLYALSKFRVEHSGSQIDKIRAFKKKAREMQAQQDNQPKIPDHDAEPAKQTRSDLISDLPPADGKTEL